MIKIKNTTRKAMLWQIARHLQFIGMTMRFPFKEKDADYYAEIKIVDLAKIIKYKRR